MMTKKHSRTLKSDRLSSYPVQQKTTQIAIIPDKMTNHVERLCILFMQKVI